VGKSTAAGALESGGTIRHVDLDAVLRSRREDRALILVTQDWAVVEPVLAEYDALTTDPPTLITIGAGTLDRDREHRDHKLEHWLIERRHRVILIEGDRAVLFSRTVVHQDAPERFAALEFGPARMRIYETAGHVVSFIGVGPAEAANRLAMTVRLASGIELGH